MSEPVKPADKAELLTNIQAGYEQLEALLAHLNEEQMITPGVKWLLVHQRQPGPPDGLAELPGSKARGHPGWHRTARSSAWA